MPLVRISLLEGKPQSYRSALADGVHCAMVEALEIPAQDRFQVVTEHSAGDLIYDPSYLDIRRSDNFVLRANHSVSRPQAGAETETL